MKTIYIGLDCAQVGGVALYDPQRNFAQVTEIRGDPIQQLTQLNLLLIGLKNMNDTQALFVFERLHDFRNKITVRSLLERSGFLKWSLVGVGFDITEASPDVARAFLGTKTKEGTFKFFGKFFRGPFLTNNHTDALALALYRANLDGTPANFDEFKLERLKL